MSRPGLVVNAQYAERLRKIFLATPCNVVRYVKDDISSKKLGPTLTKALGDALPEIQKHLLALFLIEERPDGWHEAVFEHMNLLHRNSYYLWDLSKTVHKELKSGFASDDERGKLARVVALVVAKHRHPRGELVAEGKAIPNGEVLNEANKLPVDMIHADSRKNGDWRR